MTAYTAYCRLGKKRSPGRRLDRAGLVKSRRDGREMRWSIRADRLDAATKEMRAVADSWDRRLLLIKQIAEEVTDESRRAAESTEKNSKGKDKE